jgi:CHAD domain-containing protein
LESLGVFNPFWPTVAKLTAKGHVTRMVLRPSSKSAPQSHSPAERTRPHPAPRLDAAMACDTAFRVIARRGLKDLTANHAATCEGGAGALHHMRIALTRLRTAISFFSPMVAGPQRTRIRDELKWLNAHLGVVRDLDVAIERLRKINKQRQQAADDRSWQRERAASQRHLARVLRSTRYQRLVKSLSTWVEKGSWSTRAGKRAAMQRACPIAEYSAHKLARWQEKLIRKSHKLQDFGIKKRHRLRLLNKKLNYAIGSVADLIPNDETPKHRAMVKYLRKAQKALGQLNDDARGRSLAPTVGRGGIRASQPFLSPKREQRLLRSAATAYKKLAELKPLRLRDRGNS